MRQECHTLRKFPTLLCLPACGTVLEESTAAQLTTSLVFVELKINNRLHKTSLLDPNLSQMNPVRIYIPYLFNNLDIMPSSTFRFPFRPFSKFVTMSRLSHITTYPVHITIPHEIIRKLLRDWLTDENLNGAKSLLRSQQLLTWSRHFLHPMELEGSLQWRKSIMLNKIGNRRVR